MVLRPVAACALLLTLAVSDVRALTPVIVSAEACLPFEMPNTDVLFGSSRTVFAHYFNRLPLSIDNQPAIEDYYTTQYLQANGEQNKWLAQGGYLRSRPIAVFPKANYAIENLKLEIRLAIARGITGFAFDILSLDDLKAESYLPNLIAAAQAVDPRFQILLMPDMTALAGPADVQTIVEATYTSPSLYRVNGHLAIAPFYSEGVTPAAWDTLKRALAAKGTPIALIPTFLSLSQAYVEAYQAVSDGLGTFGTPLPSQLQTVADETGRAHAAGKWYLAGLSGQGYRPKAFSYWESHGSLAYRNGWLAAITSGAESVQLTTWNDYGESTALAPITDHDGNAGTGYYNLTGYYALWFLTGHPPAITHDVLYYFYRKEPVNALAAKAGSKTDLMAGTANLDEIELVAYLTAAGTLSLASNGTIYTSTVDAGVQSLRAPLGVGSPQFTLTRQGVSVIDFAGVTPVVGPEGLATEYADLTYWSGSASALGTCFSHDLPLEPGRLQPAPLSGVQVEIG